MYIISKNQCCYFDCAVAAKSFSNIVLAKVAAFVLCNLKIQQYKEGRKILKGEPGIDSEKVKLNARNLKPALIKG